MIRRDKCDPPLRMTSIDPGRGYSHGCGRVSSLRFEEDLGRGIHLRQLADYDIAMPDAYDNDQFPTVTRELSHSQNRFLKQTPITGERYELFRSSRP